MRLIVRVGAEVGAMRHGVRADRKKKEAAHGPADPAQDLEGKAIRFILVLASARPRNTPGPYRVLIEDVPHLVQQDEAEEC